jgi:hypothetical protein
VKLSKKQIAEKRIDYLYRAANMLGIEIHKFHDRQFRLSKAGYDTLDYYPKGNKVFFIEDKEWGEITNLDEFLKFQFLPHKKPYTRDKV